MGNKNEMSTKEKGWKDDYLKMLMEENGLREQIYQLQNENSRLREVRDPRPATKVRTRGRKAVPYLKVLEGGAQ